MSVFEQNSFAGGEGGAEEMMKFALADNTRRVYELGWRKYREFCARHGLQPLAGSRRTVEWFIWEMATRPSGSTGRALSPVSIGAYCCGISNAYIEAGLAPPIDRTWLRRFLQGLSRKRDFAPKQAFPLNDRHILAMLRLCGGHGGLRARRDAALIAVFFAAALRRSELLALKVRDLRFVYPPEGDALNLFLHIRRSKTGPGRVPVPWGRRILPVMRLRAWLGAARLRAEEYVFQSLDAAGAPSGMPMTRYELSRLVRDYAGRIGLDPAVVTTRSFRVGFVTVAVVNGASIFKIMEVTRHRNPSTVMAYVRQVGAFRNHAGGGFL